MSDSPDSQDRANRQERRVAVALSYDKDSDSLPRIVASGRGAVADQILDLAFANGVRVREDRELAEMLSLLDIDSEIPDEAIYAVAEILSYLYRMGAASPPPEPQS